MKYLWKLLRAHVALAGVFVLLGVVNAFLGTLSAGLLENLLDAFSAGALGLPLLVLYGGVLAAHILLEYLDNMPDVRLPFAFYTGLKQMALQKMSRIDYRACTALGTGSLVQRIENGASAGRDILYSFWLSLVRSELPAILFALAFIWRIDRRIMLYIAIGYVVVFAINHLLLRVLYRHKRRLMDHEELLGHVLVRGLTELVVFRTHRRYLAESRRAELASTQIIGAQVAIRMVHEAFFAAFALLVVGIKVVVVFAGYQGGGLTMGALASLLLLIDRAYQPIAIANVKYVDYKLNRSAFARLSSFLDLPEDPRLSGGQPVGGIRGAYRFEQVAVVYDGRPALDGLTATLAPGNVVALVGQSGGGKSTVAKLLAGLLRPDSGRVLVDGIDLAVISLDDYYQHISYTGQDAPVFAGTLRENLVFDQKTEEIHILSALKQVELDRLVDALPRGLETGIGERGVLLSGGERQRLALARLFLDPRDVVILDEATSALDAPTESRVMARLLRHLDGRTVVLIAHRLQSLRGVDAFWVIRQGRLEEQGNFEDLMQKQGAFYALWQAAQREGDFS